MVAAAYHRHYHADVTLTRFDQYQTLKAVYVVVSRPGEWTIFRVKRGSIIRAVATFNIHQTPPLRHSRYFNQRLDGSSSSRGYMFYLSKMTHNAMTSMRLSGEQR